jgi:hypothetical protein
MPARPRGGNGRKFIDCGTHARSISLEVASADFALRKATPALRKDQIGATADFIKCGCECIASERFKLSSQWHLHRLASAE